MQQKSGFRFCPAVLAVSVILASGVAAAETRKAGDPSMGFDNPTVGTFGKHQGSGSLPSAPAHPSAPVAAPPPPKVEAESPAVMPASPSGPASLPAAPRADAKVEGQPAGTVSGPPMIGTGAPPPDGFLAQHPAVSGLVAGLIGSDLGSLLYGGPMMGDETAANIGLLLRVALVVLAGVMLVKGLARRMLGGQPSPYGPREPTFARPSDEPNGRREPRL